MSTFPTAVEPLETRALPSRVVPALTEPPAHRANPVVVWNAVTLQAVRAENIPPPMAARDLAVVQAAVYDAVDSAVPSGPAYRVRLRAPAGASAAAAVAGAAHEALTGLFPRDAALFDAALERSLAGLRPGRATAAGLALGRDVADRELAARAHDGSGLKVTYSPGAAPGRWRPTPPAFAPPLYPQGPGVTPFVLGNAARFRPPGPPPLTSPEYAAAVDQVEALGGKSGSARTPDQTEVALFWADGGGTATPPGHWNEVAEQLALSRRDGLVRSARVFALLDLALADAGIATWDCKYADGLWRPVTAIRQAATDGNPGTAADPSWAPLLATPPFPSYVSGHSTFSAAAAAVLGAAYGPHTPFTATSDALPGVTRSFPSFAAAAAEAGVSRVYGGIHFPFDNRDGLALGQKIGAYVLRHAFARGRA